VSGGGPLGFLRMRSCNACLIIVWMVFSVSFASALSAFRSLGGRRRLRDGFRMRVKFLRML